MLISITPGCLSDENYSIYHGFIPSFWKSDWLQYRCNEPRNSWARHGGSAFAQVQDEALIDVRESQWRNAYLAIEETGMSGNLWIGTCILNNFRAKNTSTDFLLETHAHGTDVNRANIANRHTYLRSTWQTTHLERRYTLVISFESILSS